jgi:hypothetical protein
MTKQCLYILIVIFITFSSINSQEQTSMMFLETTQELIEKNKQNPQINSTDLTFIDTTPSAAAVQPNPFTSLLSTVDKITYIWSQIVTVFRTTRTSTLKTKLLQKGFDYFNESAQLQISKSISADYIDRVLGNLQKKIKIPQEKQEGFNLMMEEALFSETMAWSGFNTMFSVDKGGQIRYSNILISQDVERNTYDLFLIDVNAEFKLAPDVFVISKMFTTLGGLYNNVKEEMLTVPKSLTQEDIETVMNFFQIIAYKTLAGHFGVKLQFPKLSS